jgi:uncharacterized membrane protein
MDEIMKKKMFTTAGVVLALVFWFFDAVVHHFIYGEPEFEYIPSDFNELWMRLVIVILIVLFGIFADYFTNKIMFKQKQLEMAQIYGALIHTSRDILDNLLLQMQLFKTEATKSQDFDREIIRYYDNSIAQLSDLVTTLSKVERALKEVGSLDEA